MTPAPLSRVWDLPGSTPVTACQPSQQHTRLSSPTLNMFSIFSKSVKTIPEHHHHLLGPPGAAIRCHGPSSDPAFSDNTALEVRSNINFQTNNMRHYTKYRERRRTGGRNKHFRSLFVSDCEDEITSVVSDNPQLYHRSASMVSLNKGVEFYNFL